MYSFMIYSALKELNITCGSASSELVIEATDIGCLSIRYVIIRITEIRL